MKYGLKTDIQPDTKPKLKLSSQGVGGQKIYKGNPVSWTVDPLTGCLPWTSFDSEETTDDELVRKAQTAGLGLAVPPVQDYSALIKLLSGSNPYSTAPATSTNGNSSSPNTSSGNGTNSNSGGSTTKMPKPSKNSKAIGSTNPGTVTTYSKPGGGTYQTITYTDVQGKPVEKVVFGKVRK